MPTDVSFWMAIVYIVAALGLVTIISITIAVPLRSRSQDRREREQTKREIAAYVAEGSIPPETGVELMRAAALGDTGAARDELNRLT